MIELIENHEALGTIWHIEIYDIPYTVQYEVNIEENISRNNIEFVSKEEIYKTKKEVEEMINTFEKLYTRFDENSLLNKYNRGETETEDADLMEMIRLGKKYNLDSDGVFDIYIKDKLESIGYNKSNNIILNKEEKINNKNIDLGGIGKGYLIDKIKNFLLEKGIKYFLINGGGDIYMTSDNEEPIELYMEHPLEPYTYIYKIKLKNKAFCVSSSFKRSWKFNGKLYNHFIDNRKNNGLQHWATAYVIGDTATVADVYATIACIDSEQIKKLNSNNLEYFIIKENGDILKSKNYPELQS